MEEKIIETAMEVVKEKREKKEEVSEKKPFPFLKWAFVFIPLMLVLRMLKPFIGSAINIWWLWAIAGVIGLTMVVLNFAGEKAQKFFQVEFVRKIFSGLLTVGALVGLWVIFQHVATKQLIIQLGWTKLSANIILTILAPLIVYAVWKLSAGSLPGKAGSIAGATLALSVCWMVVEVYDYQSYPYRFFDRSGKPQIYIDPTDPETKYGSLGISRLGNEVIAVTPEKARELAKKKGLGGKNEANATKQPTVSDRWVLALGEGEKIIGRVTKRTKTELVFVYEHEGKEERVEAYSQNGGSCYGKRGEIHLRFATPFIAFGWKDDARRGEKTPIVLACIPEITDPEPLSGQWVSCWEKVPGHKKGKENGCVEGHLSKEPEGRLIYWYKYNSGSRNGTIEMSPVVSSVYEGEWKDKKSGRIRLCFVLSTVAIGWWDYDGKGQKVPTVFFKKPKPACRR